MDRPACIAASSFSKTSSKPMQTAGGWCAASTTTFCTEQRRAALHTAPTGQHNARGMSRQQLTATRQQSSSTTKLSKWQNAGATYAASSAATTPQPRRITEGTAPLRPHNARMQRRRRAQKRQHHWHGQKGSKMDQKLTSDGRRPRETEEASRHANTRRTRPTIRPTRKTYAAQRCRRTCAASVAPA